MREAWMVPPYLLEMATNIKRKYFSAIVTLHKRRHTFSARPSLFNEIEKYR